MIEAIETRYCGYCFRSRLEARWSVFLTELGLDWRYEPQGFDLPAGPYLPDFWVEEWQSWLEIKPTTPTIAELNLCASLAGESGQRVLLFAGDCWPAKHATYEFHEGRGRMFNLLGECPACRRVSAILALEDGVSLISKLAECGCPSAPILPECGACIFDAYTAARSARFEHGEAP